MANFWEEAEKEGMVYTLVVCGSSCGVDRDLPLDVQHMLSKFTNLMLEDIPLTFHL